MMLMPATTHAAALNRVKTVAIRVYAYAPHKFRQCGTIEAVLDELKRLQDEEAAGTMSMVHDDPIAEARLAAIVELLETLGQDASEDLRQHRGLDEVFTRRDWTHLFEL